MGDYFGIESHLVEEDPRIARELDQREWELDPDYALYQSRAKPLRASHRHHRKRRPHCTPEEYTASWNLLDVTPALHHWIHEHPAEAYKRGWLVHSWDDPREVAVEPHPELRLVA